VLLVYVQVQAICRLVLRRSARLATSLLVAVLRLQDWFQAPHRLVVAVDGAVFLKCTNWRKYLMQYLGEAFGEHSTPPDLQAIVLQLLCMHFSCRIAVGPGTVQPMAAHPCLCPA
jgi:hexokinase